MSRPKQVLLLGFANLAVFLAAGCGGKSAAISDDQTRANELKQVFEMYRLTVKKNQKPPATVADLDLRGYQPLYPSAVRLIQSGEIVVVWGTALDQNKKALLAYEKDAAEKGGAVLLANGSVTHMDASELRSALPGHG